MVDATASTAQIRVVLSALVDACDAYRDHERNHPTLIEHHNNLLEQLSVFLEDNGQLQLKVAEDALEFGTERVYENDQPDGLPAQLHRYGIREIQFVHGLPSWELASFIDSVNADYDKEIDADVVTALWERDLTHVRFHATNVPAGATWAADPLGTVSEYLRAGRELPSEKKYTNIHLLEGKKSATDPSADLQAMALDETELARLKDIDREDRDRDLALDVLNVLVQTLKEGGASDDQILGILSSAVREHDSPSVRAGALTHASGFDSPDVRDMVIHGLGDDSPEVRRVACELAPKHADTRVILTLASLLRADEFGAWQPEDKRCVCMAYGLTARDDGLDLLEEVFFGAKHEADRSASAAGIVVVRTAAAEELLNRIPAENPELTGAIDRARQAVSEMLPAEWETDP